LDVIVSRTKFGLALLVCLVFLGVGQSADDIPGSQPKRAERKDYYGDPLPPGVLVRMGTVRLRHFGATAVFSADGKTLISAGWDQFVRHWDLATGKQINCTKMQTGLDAEFRNPMLSPDGKIFAIYDDKNVLLYDTATGQEFRKLPVDNHARVHFSNDDKTCLLVIRHPGNSATIEVYDLANTKKRFAITSDQSIRESALAPDGRTFALIELRGRIRSFDALTGKELASIAPDRFRIWQCMAYAPNGQTLALAGNNQRIAGNNKGISIRDPKTLEEKVGIKAGGLNNQLAFSPDGAILAVGQNDSVALHEVASGREIRSLEGLTGRCFGFSPDGKVFANWGGRELALWDAGTGLRLQYRPGSNGGGGCMAVSANGKLVASGSYGPFLHLWESTTGRPVRSLKGPGPFFRACAFSPDGNWLIGVNFEGTLFMWETQTGNEVRRFSVNPAKGRANRFGRGEVAALQFTQDGKQIVALYHCHDETVTSEAQVWDAASGEKVAHRPYKINVYSKAVSGGTSMVFHVNAAFAPDGLAVTSRNDSGLIVEETTTGRHLNLIPGNLGRPIVFSPDGHFLAAAILAPQNDPFDSKSIGILVAELLTGKEVLRLDQDACRCLAFSPDGSKLATADKKALRLWDLVTGKQVREHPWQEEMIAFTGSFPATHIVFMPDGQTVATGMSDGSVLLWDMASPKTPAKGITKDLEEADVEKLWTDLGSNDAAIAYRAAMKAIQSPPQAIQALERRLKAANKVDANRVKSLVVDLDSDEFATREKAAQELVRLGEEVEPALRQALEGKPSEEVGRQIKAILDKPRLVPEGETLRALRAIYILDRLGTPEARDMLKTIASGALGARQTREAKEALERFSRRVK
jgi:WD40 repeat protein